jgi:hypothetical protein
VTRKRERTRAAPSTFDPTDHGEDAATKFSRFKGLLSRVIQVPKEEVDELADERRENEERFERRTVATRRRVPPRR